MNRYKLNITIDAKTDLKNIAKYIKERNEFAALNLIKIFKRNFILISEFPLAGKNSAAIKDKTVLIYIVKKKFIIAYRFQNNEVSILRILSAYQDIAATL